MSLQAPPCPLEASYSEALRPLFTLGEPETRNDSEQWPDYVGRYNLDASHTQELLTLIGDERLLKVELDDPAAFASFHALRVLGQLRAISAVEPLLNTVLSEDNLDEWVGEELPHLLALMGPDVLPVIQQALMKETQTFYARLVLISAIEELSKKYPETKLACIAATIHELEKWETQDKTVNGHIVCQLVDLKALEAVPLIVRAHEHNAVDLQVYGELEEVLVDIGAKEPTPEYQAIKVRRGRLIRQFEQAYFSKERREAERERAKTLTIQRNKAKHKLQKASRKKNRR